MTPQSAIVHRLKAQFPDLDLQLIVDPATHGANLKVANLINIVALRSPRLSGPGRQRHRRRAALPFTPDGRARGPRRRRVTCLYNGVGASGFWSKLSALAIDAHFLPNVLVGLRTGLAKPCFGSTIALTRQHLAEIGGFEAFADRLADDYAIGDALRARGLRVEVSDMLVAHSCAESSFLELWRHELRWARTIRSVDPLGYAGSLVTHPSAGRCSPLLAGAPIPGVTAAALAIACRIVLLSALTRNFGLAAPPYWLLPGARPPVICGVFLELLVAGA